MSDSEAGSPEKSKGRANAWTDEAKYQFLLRVVAQYKDEGKTINWKNFSMPGRTTKSLQNMWTKVNQAIADLDDEGGATTPAKRAAPRKPRAKKVGAAANEDDSDGNVTTPKSTPAKRGRPAGSGKSGKKLKTEECDEKVKGPKMEQPADPVKDEAGSTWEGEI